MRFQYLFILVCFAISGCGQQAQKNKKNDLVNMELKGKVKSWKRTVWQAREDLSNIGLDNAGWMPGDSDLFNTDGNITEKYTYQGNGELETKMQVSYNDKGKKVQELYYDITGKKTASTLYKIDPKTGFNIYVEYTSINGEVSKSYLHYDAAGNDTERDDYDAQNRLQEKKVFKYNKNGDWTQVIAYGSNPDSMIFKMTNEYDEKGNLVRHKEYDADGSLNLIIGLKYDRNNYLVSDTINSVHYGTDQLSVYNNDANGNPTEAIFYSGGINAPFRRETTVYDKAGNWIKKTDTKDGKVVMMQQCIIEYYP